MLYRDRRRDTSSENRPISSGGRYANYNQAIDTAKGRSASRNRGIMPYVIVEPCIGVKDAACVAMCPVNGIHPTPEEAAFKEETMLYIDPRSCIDCGLCADECSKQAIFPEDQVPSKWRSFIRRNAEYFEQR